MIYYKDAKIDITKFSEIKNNKGILFSNTIFCLDLEVSSGYILGGKLVKWTKKQDKILKEIGIKKAWVYLWQLGFCNSVYYGRTLEELKDFLNIINQEYPVMKVFYIHNLSYDFQFLRNILDIKKISVFARKPRKPMKVLSKEYNIEFRCSYQLTHLALKDCANNYKTTHKKLVGNLDYNKLIYPTTALTREELEYGENDILVMLEFLELFQERYQTVYNIPLTQTGEIRRVVKKMFKNDNKYHNKLIKQTPKTWAEINQLCSIFMGGYTHANALYSNQTIANVTSMDITSSYPTVMVCEKYPCSRFYHIRPNTQIDYDKYCYIIKFSANNLHSKYYNNYISSSKIITGTRVLEDNGRIVKAENITMMVTDIDYQLILNTYNADFEILDLWYAEKSYLDNKYIDYILTLYQNKTQYKGDKEKESIYAKSKEFINSLYGMTVTKMISDNILLTENGWEIETINKDEMNKLIAKQGKSKKTILNFSWGVWVTSYARRNLFRCVLKMDADVVYMDTDSIKYIGNYDKVFDDYNKEILEKLKLSCQLNHLDYNKCIPKDIKGVEHPLGVYDHDADYDFFRTLGAKKYIYQKNGELHITVAGVNKKIGATAFTDINQFVDGFVFDTEHSGKLLMTYIDDMQPFILPDGTNITYSNVIHSSPTTYELGITPTYDEFITYVQTCDHI